LFRPRSIVAFAECGPKKQYLKKILASLLIATGMTGSVFSQQIPERPDAPPPPPHHGKQHKKGGQPPLPLKELNLTDAQKESFRKQRDAFKQRMEVLKKEENITVKEWKSSMETLMKENLLAMQNILTPEQREQMKNLRAQAGDRSMNRVKEQLNLTADQMSQFKKIRTATSKQMKAIRENASLSSEEKKSSMKKLMKEQKEGFDKLLTPEQREKQKQLRPARGPKGRHPRPGMPPPPYAPAPPHSIS
jgi:Spy/CpxP family protein refolding chaperone